MHHYFLILVDTLLDPLGRIQGFTGSGKTMVERVDECLPVGERFRF